jgi:hypothetical protein
MQTLWAVLLATRQGEDVRFARRCEACLFQRQEPSRELGFYCLGRFGLVRNGDDVDDSRV